METPVNLVVQALNAVRAIKDPVERFRAASELEARLNDARSAALQMKRDAVEELRKPEFGYQRIGDALGLTKSRIQQITRTPPVLRAYAVRDDRGNWHPEGAERALPEGQFLEGVLDFRPASNVSTPLANQKLTARFGPIDAEWSLYVVRLALPDGTERAVGTTLAVHNALFGL